MAKELAIGLVIGAALGGGFKATFNQAQKSVKGLGDRLSKAYQSQSRLGTRIERAQQKQLTLQHRISLAYATGDKNVTKLVRRYERMQQFIGRATAKQQQFTAAIERAEKAQQRLQATMDKQLSRKAQREEFSSGFIKSSATATAIALPVWSTVKTFIEQEEAANNLKIAMMKADGTFGKFNEIGKIADQLGTDLPGTRKDFYNLASALQKQGISEKVLLGGAFKTAAKLNVLLEMDQFEGGEFLAKFMESHGLKDAELGKAADYLQRVMYAAGLNKAQVYESMKYYAPKVNSLGLTGAENTEKILAIEGMAGQRGLEGSTFGTGFNMMLSRMNKGPKMLAAAKKGMKAEARDMMDAAGVTFEFWDKKGNFKGIDAMIAEMAKFEQIRKKFGDEGVGLVAEELFGIEGGRLADILAQKGVAGLNEMLEKMRAQASLEDRIAQKTKTLSSALEALGGVWESAVGTFGSAFAEDIKSFANTAQNFIEGILAPWIEKHKSLIKWGVATAMGLASLSTAVFALRFAFSGLFSIAAAIKLPMQLLKAYQAAKAVDSLTGSVSRFSRFSKGIGWVVTSMKSGLVGLAKVLGGGLLRGINLAGKAVLFLGRAMLANPIGLAVTAIALGAYLIYQYWEPIKVFFSDLWTNIKTFFNSGIGNITATILNWSPLGLFYKVFAGVLSWFGIDLPNNFTEFGKNIINGLVNGINQAWESAKQTVSELGDSVKNWFTEKLGIHSPSRVFMGYGENTVDGLVIGVAKSAMKAANAVSGMGEKMQQAMPKALSVPAIETALALTNKLPQVTSVKTAQSTLSAKTKSTVRKHTVNRAAADAATAALTASYLPSSLRQSVQQKSKPKPLQEALQQRNVAVREQTKDNAITVTFNPTINVNGASGQGVIEQVQQGLQMSLREFEQMINRVVDQKMRRSY
ncbi:phage tail tape measure protein [Gallibacterium genomosp. 1]|uniref:phage tail tape measure protein n=1 Tax=Gallibacterium genomosp. 1 TaxID=155515 RepID=UPI0008027CA7|nr:phage tail tape measure protein [Gallibacterium genomosp. 1]OBW97602.1 hypothetical protein QV04_10660 [Gallibacterium genomosp. 1]